MTKVIIKNDTWHHPVEVRNVAGEQFAIECNGQTITVCREGAGGIIAALKFLLDR
jgi:hypothetical protein